MYVLASCCTGPRKSLLEQLSRTGYGHNFGEQPGGGPSVQGQLVVQILKPLLDKCVDTRKELQAHENIVSNPVKLILYRFKNAYRHSLIIKSFSVSRQVFTANVLF